MKWLLWKDYRENRLVVIAALVFLLTPHLGALIISCLQGSFWHYERPLWAENFTASSIFSLIISQLSIALIGGNAIAGERADRSAEFLASLPISRKRNLASKLLLSLAIIAVIWVTDASVIVYLKDRSHPMWAQEAMEMLGATAMVALAFFCFAWCLSSFLASPTFAVAGGLLAPLLLWLSVLFLAFLGEVVDARAWLADEAYLHFIVFSYFTICLTLAPICFGVGTWHYLRRVEP
jgi:ABC-type transport system involved in multi-copper enzyme maturation permease subunit